MRDNPFTRRGEIAVVDADGRTVLEPEPRALADRAIVANAMPLIVTSARPEAIEGYVRPDGEAMLGAYAFPDAFPWAIVTELSEENAYAVVNHMLRNLLLVGLAGFGVAAAAALFFARRLTGPILKIGEVAARVGAGDLSARVEGVRDPRRDRRPRRPDERDDPPAQRAARADEVRLARDGDRDRGRRRRPASPAAASGAARRCSSPTSAATPPSPRPSRPRWWSRC